MALSVVYIRQNAKSDLESKQNENESKWGSLMWSYLLVNQCSDKQKLHDMSCDECTNYHAINIALM